MEEDLLAPAQYLGPASVENWARIWAELERFALPFQPEIDMKVTYQTENGRIRFEGEAGSAKAAFEAIAALQELFEEPDCGCCKSTNIHCSTREYDGNKFYNLTCSACGAQLDIGQRKDGKGCWLKRTDKDGAVLPNRGWYIYAKGERHSEKAQSSYQPARSDDRVPF